MNKVKNQFDPTMMVVVVDVTKGVFPDTLHYNLRDKDRTLMTVEPSFDEFGDPCYQIPRFYAERLLQNLGGRTYLLVSPTKLIIRMPNGRGGTEPKTIIANKKCGDGKWHELSEEEILEIESGVNSDDNPPLEDELPKAVKEPKQSKAAKEPGMSKKATKKSTKTVEEIPLNETESDPDDIEDDGSIPTLDDVLGE